MTLTNDTQAPAVEPWLLLFSAGVVAGFSEAMAQQMAFRAAENARTGCLRTAPATVPTTNWAGSQPTPAAVLAIQVLPETDHPLSTERCGCDSVLVDGERRAYHLPQRPALVEVPA